VTEPPAIYVHVPFCARLCHYCDFNRVAGSTPEDRARYVEALITELRGGAGEREEWPAFGSVFVGGGTPTLLEAGDLARVVRAVAASFPLQPDAEVTVEANPETVDTEYFTALVEAGVNRVSMGAQSFAPHVLADLGRWHERDRPLEAVAAARKAGIGRVNLDLIYGAPAESSQDWAATLDTALSADIDHVSAYALTVEPSTEYAARIRNGTAFAPDEDVQAERMAATDERLRAAGFGRYELSNWALPGNECRHNLTYWRNGNWLAFGAGAHGHWDGRRYWNYRPPGRYADAVLGGQSPVAGEEILTPDEQRTERLLLGLRMAEGVSRDSVEPLDDSQLQTLVGAGLLIADQRLRLTPAGWALANDVTVRLLA
jgi:putative oxygen-independent coproporphyrinogen III oxidase